MHTINIIKLTLISLLASIVLAGCGGGGGGGSDASFENTSTGTTVVQCNVANTSWTPLNPGDVVSTTSINTVLRWDHSQTNDKRVCVDSGSATIL